MTKTYEASDYHFSGLDPDMQDRFVKMSEEYYSATGEPLRMASGYRSTEHQAKLYAADSKSGYVAPPGDSVHEKGLAIDLDRSQVSKLEELGLIDKYFNRPLMGQTKSGIIEKWHIEHPGARANPVFNTREKGVLEKIGDFFGPGAAEATDYPDNIEVPYLVKRNTAEKADLQELLEEYGIKTTPPSAIVGKTSPKTTVDEVIALASSPQISPKTANIQAKSIEGADPALKDPWIDPVNVIAGFGSGAVVAGLSTALRGILGNVIGEVGGGIVGESLESEGKPRFAWVGSLAVDMALGMATDKVLTKAVGRIKRVWPSISDDAAVDLANKIINSAEVQEAVAKVQTLPKKSQKAAQQKGERFWSRFWADESGEIGPLGKDAPTPTPEPKAQQAAAGEIGPEPALDTIATKAIDLTALGDPNKPSISILPYAEDTAKRFLADGVMPASPIAEKYAINFNLNRIESPDEIKDAISRMAAMESGGIDVARRGVITNEETEKLADLTGMSVEKLLSRRKGQSFNAEEAVAARRLLVSSATQLQELAVKATGVNASEVDLLAFRRAMTVHAGIQQEVAGMTAEAGRTLQSFRIMSKETESASRAVREWLEAGGGTEATRRMAEMVKALDTPEQVSRIAAKVWKASKWDVFLEVWINGLLSNPVTHTVNTLSNTLNALVQMPERFLAGQIGKLSGSEGVQVGEATSQAWGLLSGFCDSFVLAAKAFKTGGVSGEFGKLGKVEIPRDAISGASLDISGVPGRAIDFLGHAVRMPGRLLLTEDEFFKSIGYRMELHAQAYRTAAQEGLKGTDLATRMKDILADPPENIRLSAIDAAAYQTFTMTAGPIGQALAQAKGKVPILSLVVPFVRTPSNIFRFTMERTLLAPLMTAVRADISGGGARRDLALARMAMGSMIQMTFAGLTASGIITGGGPREKGLRDNMRRDGWAPYSILIGDTYYSYQRFDLGMVIGIAADFVEIAGQIPDKQADEIATAMAAATGQVFVNRTYLQGVSNLIEALTDPNRYGRSYLQKFVGSLVPATALTAQIERVVDPTIRATRAGRESFLPAVQTMLNEIKSRVQGYSKTLPPRRNLWGEPIVSPGGLGPDWLSPIYTSALKHSLVDKEMVSNKVSVQMPSRQIMGTNLTMKEYDEYVWLAGNGLKTSDGKGCKDTLEDLIQTPEYQAQTDGPDGGKSLLIKKTILAYRTAAQGEMLTKYPELKEIVMQNIKDKGAKLIP